ncbi:MAG: bi-domain-containing oxidoreductase [Acidimicrobiales bacterium]
MQQVAQNYKTGDLKVLAVPPPACRPEGVLVRSLYSLISTGTEVMKVTEANLSLLGKARARPDQVRKLRDSVAQQGVQATYAKAMTQLDAYTPLGYSLCGVVVDVGRGAEEFNIGQVVACAGNEFALHAELNWVPRHLCVPVPEGVEPRLAAFATVGAVALHGVRRAEPQLGETACVVGLGLVGQLVVQLLVAAGVRVVGLDVVAERCRLAEHAGASLAAAPDGPGLDQVEGALSRLTGGLGADHIFLTAGGSSNGPVEAAARLARDRARVVDVGKVRLDLPWNAYYEKELDVRFSRSYGPGRYDDRYELEGIDYPAGYVRWTECRNLSCFLDLVARGQLPVDLLVSGSFPLAEAAAVYGRLRSGSLSGIGFLFEYEPVEHGVAHGRTMTVPVSAAPAAPARAARVAAVAARTASPASPSLSPSPRVGPLRLGFIGAGNYATSMLLPHLTGRDDVELTRVATNTSLSAVNAQRRFGFAEATTEVDAVLEDEAVDAVFVVTRHHNHADLVCRSLRAGKATFVEKPLALSDQQLGGIEEVVRSTGNDRLMVGFNRRFAPLLMDLRHRFGEDSSGMLHYLVNAGSLRSTSWYANEQMEGSRFAGEGGHFLDTISWWFGSPPLSVTASSTHGRGDLHLVVRYVDGSIGNLDYVTHGNPRYPKETFEVSADRRTARFDNFRKATAWTGVTHHTRRAFGSADKGQRHMLERFLDAVRAGSPMPIPLTSLVRTTAATLAVARSLETGTTVAL